MPTINGVKYACEPCMRGHRSSKCTHSDRILIQVRKPGRPLSSCPHPSGQCNCSGLRVAIPKASSCACGDKTPHDNRAPRPEMSSTHEHACQANDQQGARSLMSTNNTASAHRIRKRSRRESSSISVSAVKAFTEAELKDLNGIQGVQTSNNTDDAPANGRQSAIAQLLEGNGQQQPPLRSLPSTHRRVGSVDNRSARESSESSLSTQLDVQIASSPSVSDRVDEGLDRPAGKLVNEEISQSFQGVVQQGVQYSGPTGVVYRQPFPTSTQPPLGSYGETARLQSQVDQMQKGSCTCGSNAGQSAPARSDLPNQTYAGYSLNGLPNNPPSASQEQVKTAFPMNPFSAQPSHSQSYPDAPPVTNTLYTIPPRYSTFQRPLTPEELGFLQRNPALFSRAAPHLAPGAIASENVPGAHMPTTHSCNCGDACNCLGCIAHPYNSRTLDFVQSIQHLMAAEPQSEDQNFRRLSMPGRPVQDVTAAFSTMNLPFGNALPRSISNNHCGNWSQNQLRASQPLTGAHSSISALPFGPVTNGYGGEPTPQPQTAGSPIIPGSGDNQDQHPLSPTAFYHVDYPIGSCSAEANNCFCGDGCACPGCLVHNGNNRLGPQHFVSDTAPKPIPTSGNSPAWPETQQCLLLQQTAGSELAQPFYTERPTLHACVP